MAQELANIVVPGDVVRTPAEGWPHNELLYETIDDGRIAIITMNRPERMNSSDPGMGARWFDAWTKFAEDDDCCLLYTSPSPRDRG